MPPRRRYPPTVISDEEALSRGFEPILDVVRTIDPGSADALAQLDEKLPRGSDVLQTLKRAVREGIDAGWLASRESAGIRFGRVKEARSDDELSTDCVHMDRPGPGHTHPKGEIDLCFAVSGEPTFDGNAPGWTVYPPGSWHVPTGG